MLELFQVHISTHHRHERDREGILGGFGVDFNPQRSFDISDVGGSTSGLGRYDQFPAYDDQVQICHITDFKSPI
jgi:hypothetical protein